MDVLNDWRDASVLPLSCSDFFAEIVVNSEVVHFYPTISMSSDKSQIEGCHLQCFPHYIILPLSYII